MPRPRSRTHPAAHHEQRVAWAELFFDLIWVFAITQITTTLAGAHTAGEAARTLLLFLPLWWGWVGTTLVANLAGSRVDRAAGRLVLFGSAGCGLLVSVPIGRAWGEHAVLFASRTPCCGWCCGRSAVDCPALGGRRWSRSRSRCSSAPRCTWPAP